LAANLWNNIPYFGNNLKFTNMEFTVKQIAGLVNGTIQGDEQAKVNKLAKIEEGIPSSISFLSNPLYTQYLYSTQASAVIINKGFELSAPVSTTLIWVDSAEMAFAKLLEMYNQIKLNKSGISKMAFIAETAKVGQSVYVGEFSFVGENAVIGNHVKIYPQVYVGDNVVIGDNTTLFSGVKIYADCTLGSHCIIHSGTVIGSDGFRFATGEGGRKVPQIGNVIIEDEVEIGANCAIDRATLGSTILKKGVKFDNLIHIAHNVQIGENTYIAAHGVIAGSTKVGKNCMFSGQVGIVGHLTIADNTLIAAQSGVSKSISKKGEAVMGSPCFEVNKYRKSYVHFKNLDSIVKRIEKLEKES
jgi:UDP-3-O-[3-hydroxymyristoyl] glucosamine N-acyltransferase